MFSDYDPYHPTLVNSEFLLGALEAAKQLSVDIDSQLSDLGLDKTLLQSPKGWLPLHSVASLLERVSEANNLPDFALAVAQHQPPLRFGPIAQAARYSDTLKGAIEFGFRYSLSNSQVSLWSLEVTERHAVLRRDQRVHYEGAITQFHTLAVASLTKGLHSLFGRKVPISYIAFRHACPSDPEIYSRFFGAKVYFEHDFDGVVFPASYLNAPLPTANSEMFNTLQNELDGVFSHAAEHEQSLANQIYNHIQLNLGRATCDLDSAAQSLNLHPRALQRALKSQGLSFRELMLAARCNLAKLYLRHTNLPLAVLADILGYQDVSAFSRAFKKAEGKAPAPWRLSQTKRASKSIK